MSIAPNTCRCGGGGVESGFGFVGVDVGSDWSMRGFSSKSPLFFFRSHSSLNRQIFSARSSLQNVMSNFQTSEPCLSSSNRLSTKTPNAGRSLEIGVRISLPYSYSSCRDFFPQIPCKPFLLVLKKKFKLLSPFRLKAGLSISLCTYSLPARRPYKELEWLSREK